MSATEFHGRQISILSTQLTDYFGLHSHVYVGTDSFVYYRYEGETRWVGPDIYVVPGVPAKPVRRSFYTWAEGAKPAVVFEFLSEETAEQDKGEKKWQYFEELGIQEYFLHQPEGSKLPEFLGWRRTEEEVKEISSDERGRKYSQVLNLWLAPEEQPNGVRLLRPYEPDGTPLPTLTEAREEAEEQGLWRMLAEDRATAATKAQTEAEERAAAAAKAQTEAEERAAAEVRARTEAEERAAAAEARAHAEAQARTAAEAELERLRAELARLHGSG
jgi:Uma2 family endonuclease